jgi:hypothetical protein
MINWSLFTLFIIVGIMLCTTIALSVHLVFRMSY